MAPPPDQQPLVRVCWTGKGAAELVDRVPISSKPGAKRVVALSLGSGGDPETSLPDLRAGDRLEICGEIEVTTDLTPAQARANAAQGGRPAGKPYDYSPAVSAGLILARSPEIVEAGGPKAKPIGKPQRIKLTHEQHHAVFVFDGEAIEIPAGDWPGDACVNLVLSASHERAKAGEILLVGQNEFNGDIEGDMASLCALRFRPGDQPVPKALQTTKLLATTLPLQGAVKRVIYSLPLPELKADEQLRIRADVKASAKALGYPGRLKTRAFLADSPDQLEPSGQSYAASVAASAAQITKGNGFNCLPDRDATFAKVGIVRMLKDSRKTLHVNVVGVAGDPKKHGEATSLRLLPGGRLSVVRYPDSAFG